MADLTTGSFSPVLNAAYNTSASPNQVTPFPTVFGYDQARLATSPATTYAPFDKGWFSPSAPTSALMPTAGYTVNLAGGQTVDFVGELGSGDFTRTLLRGADAAAGWQLLGNPYPAPLDWSTVLPADRPDLDAALYVYESTGPYAGRYRSYVNNIGNPIIPLGQAFFVRVADGQPGASLTLRNRHRLSSPDATRLLRAAADTRPQLQLALRGPGPDNHDVTHVYFEAGATTGVDAEYDAPKLPNTTGLNLATMAGNQALAVAGWPLLTAATVVPLQVAVPVAGSYTLEAAQLLNLPPGTRVYLHDAQTGQQVDLHQQARYSFTLGTTSAGARFSLVFRPGSVTATANAQLAAQATVYPNPARQRFTLRLPATAHKAQRATAILYNALGQQVARQELAADATGLSATFDVRALAAGVYVVRVTLENAQFTKRVVVE
ncbi:T9SS type A sorting domain-containing protein [Hymenobacter rubripertinctus]|uniref:T9SS C-terminal target domain-containing protein n=1 Tax=Hymenobacter rubripertinctus TaxID=2029981 RepID=A0A418QIE9_9BACT|nr:T9SS type A sorting domain-containing protein [Hymenobacter rubripertinctus]RIY04928.1 T9SS C-terminal target domain-containing protein [Hymenobacter rubripertinctus]